MPTKPSQLIVGVHVGRTKRRNADHIWRTTRRAGVVTVERAPGLARDASARPMTPEEREERDIAVVAALEHASASVVGRRFGMSRGAVLGVAYRHRQSHGLQPTAVTSLTEARAARHLAVLEALQTSTVEEVAERLGCSVRTVRDIRLTARCAAEALPEPPRPTPPVERVTLLTSRAAPQPMLPAIEPVAPTPIAAPAATFVCTAVERVSLIDAGHGQCRSLADDGLCCSVQVVAGRSWCPEHLARYTRPDRRRVS